MNKQTNIPVFYTTKMVADSESASPSAAKPAKVVESWLAKFPISIIEPEPASGDDLRRAHDSNYVDGVLNSVKENGFGNRSNKIAESLPYTSGAMLSAAREALYGSLKVAAAPCSGFHHAEHARPMGFCTFNGLMVTALALKAEGAVKTVGILDLDMHYGNGTDHIIQHTGSQEWCKHYTAGYEIEHSTQVPYFFDTWLPTALEGLKECSIVLYQAGADPHIKDPYGGWMTTEEMRKRDAIVFDYFKTAGAPIVWNLAGGYQVEADGSIPKVLEIHDNTMRECVRVFTEGTVK